MSSMHRNPVDEHGTYVCYGLCSAKFYSMSGGGRELNASDANFPLYSINADCEDSHLVQIQISTTEMSSLMTLRMEPSCFLVAEFW